MSHKDRTPDADDNTARTRHFLEIERTTGDKPGAKEMAMTKRPRPSETTTERNRHFLEIEKGRKP